MKKSLLSILFVFLVGCVMACSPIFYSYFYIDGKIFFGQGGNNMLEVVGADTLSFTFDWGAPLYGKDKKYVYYYGEVLEGANPNTFEFLGGITTISFSLGYAKDDKNIYFEKKKVDFVDVNSFELISSFHNYGIYYDEGYAKDKNYIFKNGVLTSYDLATFKLLGWGYTLDKKGLYYEDKYLEGSDSQQYSCFFPYVVSANKVYHNGIEIQGCDAVSFSVLTTRWEPFDSCGRTFVDYVVARDKNNIYINNQVFNQIDIETFELKGPIIEDVPFFDGYHYMEREPNIIKDKDGKYYIDKTWIDNNFVVVLKKISM